MIELQNVRKQYGEVAAVDGVSFTVQPGELLVLLGDSGSGKTTTLKGSTVSSSPPPG
jgi:ABC-type multidrug transport system ATPase subunit